MNSKVRKLTTAAMIAAMAYLLMLIGRIPIVLFLKYDPKDAIIALGGFLLGPLSAALISITVSFVEMLTASETGIIGFVMNVISTCTFVLPAAILYCRSASLKNAAIGLGIGVLSTTAVMLLWNWLLTPIYMGYPRAAVEELLLPVFLPFNLGKGTANAVITLLIFKPVSKALKKARLL